MFQNFEDLKAKGNESFKVKKYAEAADIYSKAISIKNDESVAYSNRALCYLNMGRLFDCIADCDKAIFIDPNSTKSHYRRALANKNLYRFRLALAGFKQALKLDPESAVTQKQIDDTRKNLTDNTRIDVKIVDKPQKFRSCKKMKTFKLSSSGSGHMSYTDRK